MGTAMAHQTKVSDINWMAGELGGHILRLTGTAGENLCSKAWGVRNREMATQREEKRGQPCDICRKPMERPCDDEHPVTRRRRGWLCHNCNLGLGQFCDNPDIMRAAAVYVETH
jgi:Recombination endonuclease VII